MNFLEQSKRYADLGWSVIPCEGKRPLVPWRKYQARRADDATRSEWAASHPGANIAVITGAISGVIVVEFDGDEPELTKEFPSTATARTARGRHYYFRHPGHPIANRVKVRGFDIRGDGGYVVAPPSIHETGHVYEWLNTPEDGIADLPDVIKEGLLAYRDDTKRWQVTEAPDGERNNDYTSLVGKVLRGLPYQLWETVGWAGVQAWNRDICKPPLEPSVLRGTFESIAKREAGRRDDTPSRSVDLAAVLSAYAANFEGFDLDTLQIVLGAAVASRLTTDPLWIYIIAPPSSGKRELINALAEVPWTYSISHITGQTFFSGKGEKFSLAYHLPGADQGDVNALLLIEDLTSILDTYADERTKILSHLRQMFNGFFDPSTGNMAQGSMPKWRGKVSIIAGVTDRIEYGTAVEATQVAGERFIAKRMVVKAPDDPTRIAGAMRAIREMGREAENRTALRLLAKDFLLSLGEITMPSYTEEQLETIAQLANMVSLCRSVNIRSRNNELEHRPESEQPVRLAKEFMALAAGIAIVRGRHFLDDTDIALLRGVARDTIPSQHLLVLETTTEAPRDTIEVAERLRVPLSSRLIRRALEDMQSSRLIEQVGGIRGSSWKWTENMTRLQQITRIVDAR